VLQDHGYRINASYPCRDGQAELTEVAGYIQDRLPAHIMVTYPSTNRAQCRVNMLIKANALSPSQTAASAINIVTRQLGNNLTCCKSKKFVKLEKCKFCGKFKGGC